MRLRTLSIAAAVSVANVVVVLAGHAQPSPTRIETPKAVVQQLLMVHFAGDMAFTKASTTAKRAYLADSLNARIARYLAQPSTSNKVPAIDGDPFTGTQEYPTRFSVGDAVVTTDRASVPVRFTQGTHKSRVTYELRRQHNMWRVVDVRFADSTTFTAALGPETRR